MSIERKPGPKRLPEQDFRESYKEKETGTADERGFLVKLGVPRFAELADESFERKPQRKALYFTGDNSFGKLEVTQHSKCVGKGETMKIKVVVHKAEEGGYWAEVPPYPVAPPRGILLKNCSRICTRR
jgi:hypothetical protein